ncbi:MAG: SDR family NAD(P)-dependent oxidoreductase [Vicinamibacterales bacterium]
MFDLTDKIALVTGAGSGIGAAFAEAFAAAHARVLVTDRNEASALATAARIGGSATSFTLDVTDEAQCARRADEALASAGRLDILVNTGSTFMIDGGWSAGK